MTLAPGGRFVEQGVVLEKYRDGSGEESQMPREITEAMEPKMPPREADALSKKLSLLFAGQFTRPQIEMVAGVFREMRGTVAHTLVDETYKANKRIDQQDFISKCKAAI